MSTLKQYDLNHLERTTDEIYSFAELRAKLALNRPLRIKYGVDVTAPFLHIGHAVNLWMMRDLQECGHVVVLLIGDFTTRIGDPTDKLQTRGQIPPEAIESGAQEFINQVSQILHTDPAVLEIRRNSEWYDAMKISDFMSLLSLVTHSKLIQRDMFQKRLQMSREIYMHEMLYPLLQGYDSVMLNSDLTIVGTDQLFNELMGRFYQERFGQSPQVVLTTKITPGLDGVQKQSKSLNNFVALTDTPRDKYGKIMSLPDFLIVPYLEVYTLVPMDEIKRIERDMAEGRLNPMDAKKRLAATLVERYHGRDAAVAEEEWFTETFSKRNIPKDIPAVEVPPDATVAEVLRLCLPDQSKAAARRLIEEGAVSLNDERVKTPNERLSLRGEDVLRVGKRRWFRLVQR